MRTALVSQKWIAATLLVALISFFTVADLYAQDAMPAEPAFVVEWHSLAPCEVEMVGLYPYTLPGASEGDCPIFSVVGDKVMPYIHEIQQEAFLTAGLHAVRAAPSFADVEEQAIMHEIQQEAFLTAGLDVVRIAPSFADVEEQAIMHEIQQEAFLTAELHAVRAAPSFADIEEQVIMHEIQQEAFFAK